MLMRSVEEQTGMDVLLHIGAHRTASTTFQAYMRSNAAQWADGGVGYWGPFRLRRQMFHGVHPQPARGAGQGAFAPAPAPVWVAPAKSHLRGAR